MPSRPAGLWVRMELFCNGTEGKEWSNIFWYKPAAPPPLGNYQTDAIAIYTYVSADLVTLMNSNTKCVGAVVVFNDGAFSYGVEVYQELPGTLNVHMVPEDVSLVVQRLSAAPSKDKRGRIFVAGLDSSMIEGSYLSPAGVTAAAAFAVNEATPIVGSVNYDPYVFGPKTGDFHLVTVWNPVQLLATNRRRRPRF